MKRESNVDRIKILKVIEIISVAGKGTNDDPVHRVRDYFNLETLEWLARNSDYYNLVEDKDENE